MSFSSKSRVISLVALALFLILVPAAQAEPISQLKPTGYVNDFAHVLDQNTIAQIDEICRQIDEKAHAQIAVVTIHSLDGEEIESYAVDLFHQWGVGNKSTDRGVLILYAINDHRARIEVGYGLEPILPDGKVGAFQREAIPLDARRQLQPGASARHFPRGQRNRAGRGSSTHHATNRAASAATGGAAERGNVGWRCGAADYRYTGYSFYSASRHTFLDAFVRRWWRIQRVAAADSAVEVVLADLAAAARAAVERAAVGSPMKA